MLGHYFSVALLNFRKAPFAAVANVTALALGLTAFVTAYAVIGFWDRAERHFANADRTFIISSRIEQAGIIVKIPRDDVAATLEDIDAAWKRLVPAIAEQRRFADEIFDETHETSRHIAYVFTALGSFAVLIATVGLFAMAQVVAARRVREIGVRKLLGAATPEIVVMLLRSFSLPVVVASVAAWPIAFIVLRYYLVEYVSPVQLDAGPFVAGSLIVVAIAWLAVGAQTLRAARTAPVNVLRHE